MEPPLNEHAVDQIFVLVHGTWARRADWCKDDSDLCLALRQRFPSALFLRLEWSGRNSARARHAASRRLVAELRDNHTRYPNAKNYIVAHSHGGNIGCYALRDAQELRRNIGGLICLSTPFLHVRPSSTLSSIVPVLVSAALFLVAYLLAGRFNIWGRYDLMALMKALEWNHLLRFSYLANLAQSMMIFVCGVGFTTAFIWPIWQRFVHPQVLRLKAMLSVPEDLGIPVLIVRTQGDEAAGFLILAQSGAWIFEKLSLLVLWLPRLLHEKLPLLVEEIVNGLDRRKWVGYPVAMVLVTLVAGSFFVDLVGYYKNDLVGEMFSVVTLMVMLPFMVVLVMSVPILGFLALASLIVMPALGPHLAIACPVLQITTEPGPPGRHDLLQASQLSNEKLNDWDWESWGEWEQIDAMFKDLRQDYRLMHSEAYRDQHIIAEITTWIACHVTRGTEAEEANDFTGCKSKPAD
jgi:pimeloyl-ACP methyl ester carboxylesterase